MAQTVGVIGLGTMGAGIVEVCLAAGHDVIAFDGYPEAREKGIERVRKGFARRVEKGTMEQADADAAVARLTGTRSSSATSARWPSTPRSTRTSPTIRSRTSPRSPC